MRKRIAALVILVLWLATPAAGQGMDGAGWSGPDKVLPGEVVVLRLTLPQYDAETVTGSIQFDGEQLAVENVETAPGWELSFSQRSFTLTRGESAGEGLWIEFALRVRNLTPGTKIGISANDLTLSRQGEQIPLGNAQWEMAVWSGFSAEKHLTELWVEQGTMWPEFQSDRYYYQVTVPADTKKPVVHAVAAPGAQLEISAPYFTREGKSEVTVTVTAEDGSQLVYTLLARWETSDGDSKPLLTNPSGAQMPSGTQGTPGWVIAAGVFGGAALLGAAVILIERIVKKNR